MRPIFRITVLSVIVALSMTGAPWFSLQGVDAQSLKPIKFGLAVAGYLPQAGVYLAKEKGFFSKEGLDVTIVHFGGGPDLLRAVAARAVDMGEASNSVIAPAVFRGVGAKAVLSVFRDLDMVVVARANSQLRSASELNGKRVAITRLGSGTDFVAHKLSQKFGINIERVPVGVDTLGPMLAGRVDAAVAWEPRVTDLTMKGEIRALAGGSGKEIAGLYESDSIFATDQMIGQRPEDVRRVLKAYLLAVDLIFTQPEETTETLAKFYDIPRPLLSQLIRSYLPSLLNRDGSYHRQGLENMLNSLRELKIVEGPVTVDQFVDFRFLPLR